MNGLNFHFRQSVNFTQHISEQCLPCKVLRRAVAVAASRDVDIATFMQSLDAQNCFMVLWWSFHILVQVRDVKNQVSKDINTF